MKVADEVVVVLDVDVAVSEEGARLTARLDDTSAGACLFERDGGGFRFAIADLLWYVSGVGSSAVLDADAEAFFLDLGGREACARASWPNVMFAKSCAD